MNSPPTAGTDNLEELGRVIADAAGRDRNEAETRHKIIDFILHNFLAWPRNRVAVEEMIGRQAYRLAQEPDAAGVALAQLMPEDLGEPAETITRFAHTQGKTPRTATMRGLHQDAILAGLQTHGNSIGVE